MIKYNQLLGYDNRGQVFDAKDFILRKINKDYLNNLLDIFSIYKNNNLNDFGIVNTNVATEYGENFLKHEKHIITYPYEWSVNMIKDATLFQLDLFIELDKYNLTLKDAVPGNIIFKNTKPIFVDFLSILKIKDLIKEDWLFENSKKNKKDFRFLILEKMFIPFFFIPLVMMKRKNVNKARDLLFNHACNALGAKTPTFKDLIKAENLKSSLRNIYDIFYYNFNFYRNKKRGFVNYCTFLKDFISHLDLGYLNSNYTSYYSAKKEDFDFNDFSEWKDKQKSVYSVIKFDKPKTVLDFGANTGWFSELACRNGANVIATDIDEAAMNFLYKYANAKKLNILPLVLSFQDLLKNKLGQPYGNSLDKQKLFIEPLSRLKSDLVLSLALVHHLVLGQGISIEKVVNIFAELTNKTLVLEYVDWNDNLIKNEPIFFNNINKFNKDAYCIDIFIEEGKKYFTSVEILNSHPNSRKLLVFRK